MATQATHPEVRQLRRVQDGRLVGGVAAGIAEYVGTEVLVIRIAFIGATLIGGVGAVLYVLALLLIPRADNGQAIIRAPRRAGVGSAVFLGLLALGGSILIGAVDVLGTGKVGVAAYLVALGLSALWWRDNMAEARADTASAPVGTTQHENPYPPSEVRLAVAVGAPRGRSWTFPTLSLALVVAGFLALLNAGDVIDIDLGAIFAAALGVVGLGLIVSAFVGRAGGLIPIGIVLAVVVATLASTGASFSGGFGERAWAPTTVAEIPSTYELGAGDAQLDLTGLGLPPGATTVRVEVGAGNLEVVVPDDVDLDITAAVGIGNIDVEVDGQNLNDAGFGAEISQIARAPGANSALKLEFDVSFGNILVEDLQPR